MSQESEQRRLLEGAAEIGAPVEGGVATHLLAYLELLLTKNKKLNLTAIRNREEAIEKHLIDSLSLIPVIDRIPPTSDTSLFDGRSPGRGNNSPQKGALLDIGTGGGLPGIPIKCARPDIRVTLVEAKAKKVHFLKEVIQKMNLRGIRVYQHFLDPECPVDFLGRYDWIVTRATMTIPEFLRNAILYKKENGALIMMKGPKVDLELEAAANHIQRLGLKLDQRISFKLPFSGGERVLIILR